MGICLAGLVPVEASDGFRSLDMCMDCSLVQSLVVLLPISGSVLGKMATDRALENRLIVIRIKAVDQGWADTHQQAKEEP